MSDLKTRIMSAALTIAGQLGIAATSRNAIAARVECSSGSVSFHYGNGRELQRAIVLAAIETSNYAVMGAAIAERHPSAAKIPDHVRAISLRTWIGK